MDDLFSQVAAAIPLFLTVLAPIPSIIPDNRSACPVYFLLVQKSWLVFYCLCLSLIFLLHFRVCGISEGLYTFQTLQGQQIYERVHTAVMALAEQHKSLLLEMEKNARVRITFFFGILH